MMEMGVVGCFGWLVVVVVVGCCYCGEAHYLKVLQICRQRRQVEQR